MCMCKNKALKNLLAVVILVVALLLAVVVSFWKQEGFAIVVNVSRFFDVMIPILAVGALIKYLFSCHGCHYHKEGEAGIYSEKTRVESQK